MKLPSPEIVTAMAMRLVEIGIDAEKIPSDELSRIVSGRLMLIVVDGAEPPCPCCNKKALWAATAPKTKLPLEKLFR